MKKLFFTSAVLGLAFICNAQQAKAKISRTTFTPPVIVKDAAPAKPQKKEAVKFTPPVIKENKTRTTHKHSKAKPIKFTPPVIVKD